MSRRSELLADLLDFFFKGVAQVFNLVKATPKLPETHSVNLALEFCSWLTSGVHQTAPCARGIARSAAGRE